MAWTTLYGTYFRGRTEGKAVFVRKIIEKEDSGLLATHVPVVNHLLETCLPDGKIVEQDKHKFCFRPPANCRSPQLAEALWTKALYVLQFDNMNVLKRFTIRLPTSIWSTMQTFWSRQRDVSLQKLGHELITVWTVQAALTKSDLFRKHATLNKNLVNRHQAHQGKIFFILTNQAVESWWTHKFKSSPNCNHL